LLAAGVLRQVVHGVFVDARAPDTPPTWLDALRLAVPSGAVVAGRSAAWVHGVDVRATGPPGAPHVVECVAPASARLARRRGIRCRAGPLDDDVDEVGGVRCTSPLRTAADLLSSLPRHVALAAVDAMAHQGLFTGYELRARLGRCGSGPGLRRARRLASQVDERTESFGESWTRLRIADARFPRPVAQVPLWRDGRVEFRIDLGYPALRIGVEYDGMQHHTSAVDRRDDEARRTRIRLEYGWTLLVVDRGDVLGRSLRLEEALGDLLGQAPRIRRRTW
jgi:very-short-patch-repair endonuclease